MAAGAAFSWQDDLQTPQTPKAAQAAPSAPGLSSYDQIFGSSEVNGNLGDSMGMPSAAAAPTAEQGPSLFKPSYQPTATGTGQADMGAMAQSPAAPSGGPSPQPTAPPAYADTLTKIQQTTDPRQKAVLQDQLARDLFSTLRTAGHDVKWQGDQLIVDGRPYVVGDGSQTGPGATADGPGSAWRTPETGPGRLVDGPGSIWRTPEVAAPMPLPDGPGSTFQTPQTGPVPSLGPQGINPDGSITHQPTEEQSPNLDASYMGMLGEAGPAPTMAHLGSSYDDGSLPGADGIVPSSDTPSPPAAPPAVPNNVQEPAPPASGTPTPPSYDEYLKDESIRRQQGLPSRTWEQYQQLPRIAGSVGQYGIPAGADATKFGDASYHSPKYDLLRTVSRYPPTADGLRQAVAEANANGGHYQITGDDTVIDTSNGDHIDLIQDVGGPNAKWWFGSENEYAAAHPSGGAPTGTPTTIDVPNVPGAAGVPTGGVPQPGAAPGFTPTAPSYTPGAGPNNSDLDPFSFDALLAKFRGEDPNLNMGDLGPLGAGATDPETEALVRSILEHPESLSNQDVDRLKATSKDELAQMAKSDDEDLLAQSYLTGNQDSNWTASERLARRGQRDQALVQSNRAIDTQAAATRMGDRRAAAQLGQSYAESKAGRNLSERQQRFTEAQTRISNQFKTNEDRRAAAQLAADTTLKAASLKNDRFALEESLKQKATELGQSADKIRLDYTLGLMDDITKRYGLDLGAAVDREKLSQAGREFQQDLIFRLTQLAQQDRQFGASYGLDVAKTQHTIDQDNYDRYKAIFG